MKKKIDSAWDVVQSMAYDDPDVDYQKVLDATANCLCTFSENDLKEVLLSCNSTINKSKNGPELIIAALVMFGLETLTTYLRSEVIKMQGGSKDV